MKTRTELKAKLDRLSTYPASQNCRRAQIYVHLEMFESADYELERILRNDYPEEQDNVKWALTIKAKMLFLREDYLACIKILTGRHYNTLTIMHPSLTVADKKNILLGHCYRNSALNAKANGENKQVVTELFQKAREYYESANYNAESKKRANEKKLGLSIVYYHLGLNTLSTNICEPSSIPSDRTHDFSFLLSQAFRVKGLYIKAHKAIDAAINEISVVLAPKSINSATPTGQTPNQAQIEADNKARETAQAEVDSINQRRTQLSVKYYYHKGLLFVDQNNIAEAIAQFSQAIKNDPNHKNSLYQRANCYVKENNEAEAIKDFETVIHIIATQSYDNLNVNFNLFIKAVKKLLLLKSSYIDTPQNEVIEDISIGLSKYIQALDEDVAMFAIYRKDIANIMLWLAFSQDPNYARIALQNLISIYWMSIPSNLRSNEEPQNLQQLKKKIIENQQVRKHGLMYKLYNTFAPQGDPTVNQLGALLEELEEVLATVEVLEEKEIENDDTLLKKKINSLSTDDSTQNLTQALFTTGANDSSSSSSSIPIMSCLSSVVAPTAPFAQTDSHTASTSAAAMSGSSTSSAAIPTTLYPVLVAPDTYNSQIPVAVGASDASQSAIQNEVKQASPSNQAPDVVFFVVPSNIADVTASTDTNLNLPSVPQVPRVATLQVAECLNNVAVFDSPSTT